MISLRCFTIIVKNFGSKVKVARKYHAKKDEESVVRFKKTLPNSAKKKKLANNNDLRPSIYTLKTKVDFKFKRTFSNQFFKTMEDLTDFVCHISKTLNADDVKSIAALTISF